MGQSVVDVEDFKRNTLVNGVPANANNCPTAALFWQYMQAATQSRRMQVVHWVSAPAQF